METYPGEKCNSSEDTTVRYHDNDNWPAHPPVGLWSDYGLVNDFMNEWGIRKKNSNPVRLQTTSILNGKAIGQ